MLPPVPDLEDYGITEQHGFLPMELPLEILPDPYYNKWEAIITNLQALLLSRRLREVVKKLPILSTTRLHSRAEWRRAYLVLAFITHGYIWGGDLPEERIPPSISIPFLKICRYLELPPVATYAGVCLWNFRPIFSDEPIDSLENLATLTTFTGSLDESWFYLVSVAIEARGAPLIPLLTNAIRAARLGNAGTVTHALQVMAERMDELGSLLNRMYEHCDPHVFYHRIRPFLAGSKNMADAGLPNGVIYEDGSGTEPYRQYGGGSNAQSSLIQFFDIILGVTHRPTGTAAPTSFTSTSQTTQPTAPPPSNNFILEMRSYMPGPHTRFLQDISSTANIREIVLANPQNRPLSLAYDAALAMLRTLRDKHIQLVSRYIVVKSRESRSPGTERALSPQKVSGVGTGAIKNIATANANVSTDGIRNGRSKMRGTGGTALIPFLKQARDETGEPTIDMWARRLLGDKPISDTSSTVGGRYKGTKLGGVELGKVGREQENGVVQIVGLAGTWGIDDTEGGLCHW